jgi:hypothetical protein
LPVRLIEFYTPSPPQSNIPSARKPLGALGLSHPHCLYCPGNPKYVREALEIVGQYPLVLTESETFGCSRIASNKRVPQALDAIAKRATRPCATKSFFHSKVRHPCEREV